MIGAKDVAKKNAIRIFAGWTNPADGIPGTDGALDQMITWSIFEFLVGPLPVRFDIKRRGRVKTFTLRVGDEGLHAHVDGPGFLTFAFRTYHTSRDAWWRQSATLLPCEYSLKNQKLLQHPLCYGPQYPQLNKAERRETANRCRELNAQLLTALGMTPPNMNQWVSFLKIVGIADLFMLPYMPNVDEPSQCINLRSSQVWYSHSEIPSTDTS